MKTIKLTDGRELVFLTIPFNGYAPGNYYVQCSACKQSILNLDKRAVVCEECAIKMIDESLAKLGEITGDYEADFDVEPYVEHELKSVGKIWMNYTIPFKIERQLGRDVIIYADKRPYKFDEAKDSFKSLMNANDIWMHNYVSKDSLVFEDASLEEQIIFEQSWQEAQNKVVSKYIVLLKK